MISLVYALPGGEALASALVQELNGDLGEITLRRFPDGESYVRLLTSPKGRSVIFAGSLDRPDDKSIQLYFAATAARELGAARVGLVAPYLAYMRQDARFKPGEAISSTYFARWLSGFVDWLVTVDPHLHRHASLDDIYCVPSRVVSAASAMARWIRTHVPAPLVVGPDAESAQWVRQVAAGADCPYLVLEKQRHGDREVEVSFPDIARWRDRTPVLVDDIISTARTMAAAAAQLRAAGMEQAPTCVGVHGLFSDDALQILSQAGVSRIVTSNTIAHATNEIDIVADVVQALRGLLAAP